MAFVDLARLEQLTKQMKEQTLEQVNQNSKSENVEMLTIDDYKSWLEWVNNRIAALDVIEEKLTEMRQIATSAQNYTTSKETAEQLNNRLLVLEVDIKELDEKTRELKKQQHAH